MQCSARWSGRIAISLLVLAASVPSAFGERSSEAAPPAAQSMATLDLEGELQWYYRNDVGVLLIYAGDRLYRLDLLAEDPRPSDPLPFPGLTRERSVLPVARTGLLLIPDAPGEGGSPGSYAIDTMSGEIRWRAAPLPGVDLLFSFPDAGLAVLRSPDDGGRLIAVDLRTGERAWEIAKWARMIWSDAPYLRAVVGNTLLTLDVPTGKTVREDDATLPESKRLHYYPEEGVFLLWDNRHFTAYAIPPPPPAEAPPARKLWEFTAGSPMVGLCIKAGNCSISRAGDDLLVVTSAQKHEVLRLTTGELIARAKKGMFGAPVSVSPTGRYIASALSDEMRILDGRTGEVVHEIAYPKGGEGMKSLRYLSWPDDDLVMTVFPDKKGNPRKMIGFSCRDGSLAWSTVLPDVADYRLTSEQRAKLVGRIVASLVMTAVSAANPVSAGGTSYFAVFVPNLDVSESLAPGAVPGREGEAGGESSFAAALERYAECRRRIDANRAEARYFVAGQNRKYDVLKIDLVDGSVAPLVRYEAEKVHAIAPLAGFDRAVTLEDDNTRVRLLRLEHQAVD